ncbi:hypothetical protein UPYG_G00237020 [Umbra pygmaea]|uniref:Uncharacterized protein n=1 Tax=Umbra pygmaea TaxID=75934 RepID=A0ABD0WFD5_UMBPY
MDVEEHEGVKSEPIDRFSVERRPSIMRLQGMLRKVSQSPFHTSYKTLVPSTSESSESSLNDTNLKQDSEHFSGISATATDHPHCEQDGEAKSTWNPFDYTAQNGSLKGLLKDNPFHSHNRESSNGAVEENSQESEFLQEQGLSIIFAPPPEFQSHPQDFKHDQQKVEDNLHTMPSDQQSNTFKTMEESQSPDLLKKKTLTQNTPANLTGHHFFGTPSERQDLHTILSNPQKHFEKPDLYQTPPTKGDDLFKAPPTNGNDLFPVTTDRIDDLFKSTTGDDIFRASLSNQKDFFHSSPSDALNLFQTTPSSSYDPFQTPSSMVTSDIFQSSSDINDSKIKQSTPLFQTPRQKTDIFAGSDFQKTAELFNASFSNSQISNLATPSDKQHDIFLTTPLGSKYNILQSTPNSQQDGMLQATSLSPMQTPNGSVQVKTLNRPPKPAPRKRLPNQPSQDNKSEEVEDLAVYEDILLTGQERCVEDWPENSPEQDPNWKPSGTLKLRRNSMLVKTGSDRGSADEDLDENGKHGKIKRGKKFKVSFLSRRGSKVAHTDDLKNGDGNTRHRGSLKEGMFEKDYTKKEMNAFSEDDKENYMEHGKKTSSKFHLPVLQHRGSKDTFSSLEKAPAPCSPGSKETCFSSAWENEGDEQNGMEDGQLPTDFYEKSENQVEEDGHDEATHFKRNKQLKIKFVPRRGFAIINEKRSHSEPKGALGGIPRRSSSMLHAQSLDEPNGACGYTPNNETKENNLDEHGGGCGYSPNMENKVFLDDDFDEKASGSIFTNETVEQHQNRMEDCKPKKSFKFKVQHLNRRRSGAGSSQPDPPRTSLEDGFLDSNVPQKGADLFYVGKMDGEQNVIEDCKPKKTSKLKKAFASRRKSAPVQEMFHENSDNVSDWYSPRRPSHQGLLYSDTPQWTPDLFAAGLTAEDYEEDDLAHSKLNRERDGGIIDEPPGATSSDYYLSEAAEAEWRSAQMDARFSQGLVDEEPDGDTDSLMEWWNTVEQWDELVSDDEKEKEDQTRSFIQLEEKVERGMRVFNKLFTERAEVLWQYVILLKGLADDIANFHRKAKIGNITGGTTAAIGGGAAIVGLALAPFTFGASLIVTAVGVGVAAAGGITSASATISDNVNNMNERKKVEVVLEHYQDMMDELGKVLRFVCEGLYRLRAHTLLRAGTQHYSGDWEVRRAVQIVSLVEKPTLRATELTDGASVAVRSLFKGMNKYFTKETRELKKGCKKEAVFNIRQVAQKLHEGLVELNAIRGELQDATGNV